MIILSRFTLIILAAALFSCKPFRPKGDCTYTLLLNAGNASKEDMRASEEAIMKRLAGAGFAAQDISIAVRNNNLEVRISNYAKSDDHESIRSLLSQRGSLEFWEVYENEVKMYQYLEEANKIIARMVQPEVKETELLQEAVDTTTLAGKITASLAAKDSLSYIRYLRQENPFFTVFQPAIYQTSQGFQLMPGAIIGFADVKDTALVTKYLSMSEVKRVFPGDAVFAWGAGPEQGGNVFALYALKGSRKTNGPVLSGNILEEASVKSDESGRPSIWIQMEPVAAREWKKVTGNNVDQSIAMLIGGKVVSAPNVQAEIEGGVSSIIGDFTEEQAISLVLVLNASMSVQLNIADEKLSCP